MGGTPTATPPGGSRPLVMLGDTVPEHAVAFALAAFALGVGWLSGRLELPASMTAWAGEAVALVWAAVFGGSGAIVLGAAAARRWLRDPLARMSWERAGQYVQAGACLFYAAGALALGAAGVWAAVAFIAWAVASALRAWRQGRTMRAIGRAVQERGLP